MAKKKKTKVVANPARGVATTSIASKEKVDTPAAPEEDAKASTAAENSASSTSVKSEPTVKPPEKELHQLSPDELEAQLEKEELQIFLEKHSPKVIKESTRQVSKVHTDARLLRAQAHYLAVSEWLPDDVIEEIIKILRSDALNQVSAATPGSEFSEDDDVLRLWTLQRTLLSLGIPKPRIQELFSTLLTQGFVPDSNSYVPGFRESLDLLALKGESSLPPFEGRSRDNLDPNFGQTPLEGTPSTSRIPSPLPSRLNTPTPSNLPTPSLSNTPTPAVSTKAADSDAELISDFEVSDLDSDAEPEELLSTYLSAKTRLFKINPDLTESLSVKKKGGKFAAGTNQRGARSSSPAVRKLQDKITQIESDPFLDKDAADHKWAVLRIQLLRDDADARKRNGGLAPEKKTKPWKPSPKPETPSSASLDDDEDNDDALLGDMFATAGDTQEPKMMDGASFEGDGEVFLRDLGKFSGINPRRVLEDACRSRDQNVKITFRLISATTYHSRSAVTISWTKGQERIPEITSPGVTLEHQKYSKDGSLVLTSTVSMKGIATPDERQSESFIATAALFYLFGHSTKEEKVHLKLPSTFRDLWTEFVGFRKEQEDAVERETIKELREIVRKHREKEEEDGVIFTSAFRARNVQAPTKPTATPLGNPTKAQTPQHLQALWHQHVVSPNYNYMLGFRMQLPMFNFKEKILATIHENQVTILCGETGCGKSTQLPAYILEQQLNHGVECKVLCTQPRRISAISLAQRVSEELGEYPRDLGHTSLVGYAVRLESKYGPHTRLIYATVGVVLRILESSPELDDYTHLILDETHERSIETDFLIVILRTLITKRPDLKVILMSATMDAARFSSYFGDTAVVQVPGRTFPVQDYYLEDALEMTRHHGNKINRDLSDEEEVESSGSTLGARTDGLSAATQEALASYDEYQMDYELIVKLMEQVMLRGELVPFARAILVFLPGIQEIRTLNSMLVGHELFSDRVRVFPLHSSLSSEEQRAAFEVFNDGSVKVVLSTNIAETGVTIPDITCVIDTGRHKEMRYDERRQSSRLITSFISKANAKQRRGRAGRVQKGICFHLFTKKRLDEFMPPQQTPEMLRLSLQDLVMRVKICNLGDVEGTLLQALDPPPPKKIRAAIDSLIEVGAFTSTEELTPLGRRLASLPLEANLGKLVILSSIFGCVDAGLTIAAILSSKSPFVTPFGARQQADAVRLGFARGDSDILTAFNAYLSWKRVSLDPNQNTAVFCRKNFLSQQVLMGVEDIKRQLAVSLYEAGMLEGFRRDAVRSKLFVSLPPEYTQHNQNDVLISSVIAYAFWPHVLTRDGKGWKSIAGHSVSLHPTSVNRNNPHPKYLSYHSLMSTGKYSNALSTTSAHDMPLMLAAGEADVKLHAGVVTIDSNRLRFRVKDWKTAIVIKHWRRKMEEVVEEGIVKGPHAIRPELMYWKGLFEKICTPEVKDN